MYVSATYGKVSVVCWSLGGESFYFFIVGSPKRNAFLPLLHVVRVSPKQDIIHKERTTVHKRFERAHAGVQLCFCLCRIFILMS